MGVFFVTRIWISIGDDSIRGCWINQDMVGVLCKRTNYNKRLIDYRRDELDTMKERLLYNRRTLYNAIANELKVWIPP